MEGKYKRPLTSRDLIGLWKEKRYRRNMMFLFAGHSAGLLSKNFVKQSSTKFLESQLHGSRRKSYLSVPFFFHLRYGWLVRGRLYMPGQRHELHHRICNLRYGTHGYGMSAYEITAKFKRFNALWFVDVKGHTSRSFIFGFCRSYSGLTDLHNLDIACYTVLA